MNFNITDYTEITEEQVDEARRAGLLIHHEFTEQFECYADGRCEWVTTRDEWFAANRDWVDNYHRSGGTWAYRD